MPLSKSDVFLCFCILFIIGIFIYSLFLDNASFDAYYDRKINTECIIVSEPECRVDQTKFEIEAENISGRILVTTNLYPRYKYGDKLKITGTIKKPAQFDDFDYQEYLAKDKIYFVIYYPKIDLISRTQGNWFYSKIFSFKDKARKVVDNVLLPPQSSILKAVLLGDKYALSDELKEKLNMTGTRHIAAISGMHMAIFSQMLLFLALAVGLWRSQAFYFVLVFLFLYIVFIGAPASAVRAGIMAGLLLLAQRFGRLNSFYRSVVFAAVIMLIVNPMLLRSDAGFQMSFCAVLSIGFFKPKIDKKIGRIPNFLGLRDVLSMTLAAQIGVLPLLIYHFKQFSLISPLANLLIVPFLPLIMILGILIIFLGLIYLPLAKFISVFVWLVLTYVIKIIEFFSCFDWAAINF